MEIKTKNDILRLAESQSVECKKAVGKDGKGDLPDNFWETYSAMANSNGGYVFLGLTEKNGHFSVAGLSSTEMLRKKLVDIANNHNKVSVCLFTNDSFEDIDCDGSKILQVRIPRAKRQQRPVYLNNNPIGNSYRRIHEADQRMTDEDVKRYMAEQLNDTRDTEVLHEFTITEIHRDTLKQYRNVYAVLHPGGPFNQLDDIPFLVQIGAMDRQTNNLTVAGLLMFGTHPVIQERFSNFMLDYQEQDHTANRWTDRITLEGHWSGNLYDFFHIVYPRLARHLKTPFHLEGGTRIDDTPAHIAIREALVNTLIHADYSGRASVRVMKRPDMFQFRNPGLMRIPIEDALRGGEADCRNKKLHQMFRYVGIGEQAGSGIPKILDGWKRSHWPLPSLREETDPYDQTIFELRIVD